MSRRSRTSRRGDGSGDGRGRAGNRGDCTGLSAQGLDESGSCRSRGRRGRIRGGRRVLGLATSFCDIIVPVVLRVPGPMHDGPPGIHAHHKTREPPLLVAPRDTVAGGLVFLSASWTS